MSLFEQFKELKTATEKADQDLSSFVLKNKKQILVDLAKQLKQINGMNKLVVKGYTPGFNDGDACTHSSELYYECKGYYNDFTELSEYGVDLCDFLSAPEDFSDDLCEWEGLSVVNTFTDEDKDKVSVLVNYIDYIVECLYYTDYLVYIDLTTDEPTITHEDYDCGH